MRADIETKAVVAAGTTALVRAASIDVVAGPDAGRSVRVDRPVFVVGKGPGADLRLSDPSVSREHVRLTLTATGIAVSDEGSKNGTMIAGMRVERVVLTGDATLTLGATTIVVRVDRHDTELEISDTEQFGNAIGKSTAMRNVFAILSKAAVSNLSILIEGESGVGKDVLARAVHGSSSRRGGPFVAVDCGAIPANLIESELFGYERGAFTGADRARIGLFDQADGGTLFLDEMGELPLDLQPKLLRVLEAGEVRPVGGRVHPVDVRVVAATNRRLSESIRNGEFRSDLFYRLAMIRVVVPPLRDRKEDIGPLASRFYRTAQADPEAQLPKDLESLLLTYSWPGNVRELRNVVQRYALFGAQSPISLFDPHLSDGETKSSLDEPFFEARQAHVERFEREYLEHALASVGGNVAKAVDKTGIPRPTLYRMLNRLGLSKGDER